MRKEKYQEILSEQRHIARLFLECKRNGLSNLVACEFLYIPEKLAIEKIKTYRLERKAS